MRPSRSVYRLKSAVVSGGAAVAIAAGVVGCQPAPKPAPKPAPAPSVPTANEADMTRQMLNAVDPNAHVGQVAAASAPDHTAVVTGIPFADVKVGDPISFTGPNHQPFATGTIIDLDNHTNPQYSLVIVDYQKASTGGRDPGPGDLAITIPMGK